MGTVRNFEHPASSRKRLLGLASTCIDKYHELTNSEKEQRDILACIILCLIEVEKSVSTTIKSWEKRDYWVKAENFIQEWSWLPKLRSDLEVNYLQNTSTSIKDVINRLEKKLKSMDIKSSRVDNFWTGCEQKIQRKKGC